MNILTRLMWRLRYGRPVCWWPLPLIAEGIAAGLEAAAEKAESRIGVHDAMRKGKLFSGLESVLDACEDEIRIVVADIRALAEGTKP